MAKRKTMRTPSTDEDAEILDYSYIDVGIVNVMSPNSYKTKHELTYDLAIVLFGPLPREIKIHVHIKLCKNVYSSCICNI